MSDALKMDYLQKSPMKTKDTQHGVLPSSTFPLEIDDSDKDSLIMNNGNTILFLKNTQ